MYIIIIEVLKFQSDFKKGNKSRANLMTSYDLPIY